MSLSVALARHSSNIWPLRSLPTRLSLAPRDTRGSITYPKVMVLRLLPRGSTQHPAGSRVLRPAPTPPSPPWLRLGIRAQDGREHPLELHGCTAGHRPSQKATQASLL